MTKPRKKPRPEVPHVHELVVPVTHRVSGETIARVTILRRPKLKDLKAIATVQTNRVAAFALMIERLTDLPKDRIDELDVEDVEQLNEVLGPLFGEEEDEADSANSYEGAHDTP